LPPLRRPDRDQAKFRFWGHDLAATLLPHTDVAAKSRKRASELALTAYLRDLVEKRRTEPDDSLLSSLVAAEEGGDRLSSGELVATALLLLVAGFETTVNLIGNGTVALLCEPEQWRRLGEEPALVPTAVEELLRYDSPVQMTSRIATDDIELDGAGTVPKGAAILVAVGGANRDPDVFDHPNQLRIDRPEASRHLAFSVGIHHCLGVALARLEGSVAIDELTRRYATLQMVGIPTQRQLLVLRGYEQLAVRTPSSSMMSGHDAARGDTERSFSDGRPTTSRGTG
jgi:cytochrome P450